MIERRNRWRRAPAGGVVLGALAALVLALVEGVWVLVAAPAAFDTIGERSRFVLYGVLLALPFGALAGALAGVAVAAAGRATEWAPRARQAVWRARFYTALATPAVAVAAAQAFAGRRARLLPARHLLALGLGLAALAAIYFALLAAQRLVPRIAQHGGGARIGAGLLLAAAPVYAADQEVLPRLYPFFHLGLSAIAYSLCALALGALYLAAQRRGLRVGQLAGPRSVLAIVLVAVAGGAYGLNRLGRDESLRPVAWSRTCLESALLDCAHAAGLLPGARREPTPRAIAPPLKPLPAGPTTPDADVFLITIDAMRADRLTEATAPHLTALAREGVTFEHAYTQVPHTSFALATLLTGKYVRSLTALGDDPASHETLADVFQRDRYKTAAFFPPSVFFIDHDRFAEVERTLYHFEYVKYEHMGARGRTKQVIDFLEDEKPKRVFVWAHYFEPHEPYDLHPGVAPDGARGATDQERYDGEVRFVDAEIAKLIDYVRRTRPRAVIAVAADHGEEFGEHGGRYHGTTLYEEQVHVPLLIVAPGIAPRRLAGPVGLIDVAPTLLALVAITPSAKMRGQDLGPWLSQGGCDERRLQPVFAEIGSQKLIAVDSRRLIRDYARDTCEFYDLDADPREQRSRGCGPAAGELPGLLDAWIETPGSYEHLPPGGGAEQNARLWLDRGRMGDRTAARELARMLPQPDAKQAAEAAAVLLLLPPDEATRAPVAEARKRSPDDRALQVLAERLGDRSLDGPLAEWAAGAGAPPDLRAEVALALAAAGDGRALPLLQRALGECDREEREKRLIAALGASGKPEAAATLIEHLDAVRTRIDVVRALGALGPRAGAAAVAPLAERLVAEPYVPVRAEMARVLGLLGAGDRRVPAALERLLAGEKEPQVAGSAAAALAALGAVHPPGGAALDHQRGWSCEGGGCAPPPGGATLPIAARAGEALWLVAAPGATGALELGGARVDLVAEQRAYLVRVGASGRLALRPLDGTPHLAAVVRPGRP